MTMKTQIPEQVSGTSLNPSWTRAIENWRVAPIEEHLVSLAYQLWVCMQTSGCLWGFELGRYKKNKENRGRRYKENKENCGRR